jgi:hypothetical protein
VKVTPRFPYKFPLGPNAQIQGINLAGTWLLKLSITEFRNNMLSQKLVIDFASFLGDGLPPFTWSTSGDPLIDPLSDCDPIRLDMLTLIGGSEQPAKLCFGLRCRSAERFAVASAIQGIPEPVNPAILLINTAVAKSPSLLCHLFFLS